MRKIETAGIVYWLLERRERIVRGCESPIRIWGGKNTFSRLVEESSLAWRNQVTGKYSGEAEEK